MTKLARQFLAEASYRCGSTKRLDSRFFAAIAEKDVFRAQWGYWQNRLGITDPSVVSALADGAYWIWDAAFLEFSGVAQENPDIYHALEYLSNKGDALFGKETAESKIWLETMRRDLLDWGVKPVLDRVRLMASMEQLDGNKELLRVLENYLVFHSCRMNYRERLAEGKSIGSGQVEGACKNFSIFDTTKVETDRREVGSCTGGPHGGVVCRPLRRTVEGLLEQCCLAAHKVLLHPGGPQRRDSNNPCGAYRSIVYFGFVVARREADRSPISERINHENLHQRRNSRTGKRENQRVGPRTALWRRYF